MERSGVRAEQKLTILRLGTGRPFAQLPRGVVALDRKPAAQSLDRLRCGLFHHDVSAPPSGEGSRNSLMGGHSTWRAYCSSEEAWWRNVELGGVDRDVPVAIRASVGDRGGGPRRGGRVLSRAPGGLRDAPL